MEFTTTSLIATVNAIDTAATTISSIPGRAKRMAHRIATADTAAWAHHLERTARIAGILIAFLITIATITGRAAYDIGGQFRRALEARNDQLAAAWVRLWVSPHAAAPAATATAPAEPAAANVLQASAVQVPATRTSAAKQAAAAPAATTRPARRARRSQAVTA
jgi:hypothetical protein